ncbi:hypothetical protein [Saccharopolyspora sp. 5N708]|uniref:hypothetical protein n=1 Tax=Saccharopolyspora sp. 5N708 TaxID=3457424 RepID=UPI003FD1DECB
MSQRRAPASVLVLTPLMAIGGAAAIGFPLEALINYEPPCTPSPDETCRVIFSGRDVGAATPVDLDEHFFNIAVGAILMMIMGGTALASAVTLFFGQILRGRRRSHRRAAR